MGLFDRFKRAMTSRSEEDAPREDIDPLADLTLEKLRPGYLLDYDLKTWTVREHVQYDFDGFLVDEWELESDEGEIRFLELEDDDGPAWSLSGEVPLTAFDFEEGGSLARYIATNDDAPELLTYEGEAYELVEAGPAELVNDDGTRHPLVFWTYAHEDDEDRFLAIEQYGEESFDASAGHTIEPYEFDNILPGRLE